MKGSFSEGGVCGLWWGFGGGGFIVVGVFFQGNLFYVGNGSFLRVVPSVEYIHLPK